MKVSGVVDRLFTKDWPGRGGKTVVLHSFKVRGNDKFFRLGENRPNFRETDAVSFEADDKGTVSNLEVVKAPQGESSRTENAPTSATTAPARQAAGNAQSREGYWSEKEQRDLAKEERYQNVVEPRITYCSAQSDAVRLVEVACQHDMLTFGNANKSAKLGLLLDYVDQITNRFVAQRMNAAALIADSTSPEVEVEADGSANNDLG